MRPSRCGAASTCARLLPFVAGGLAGVPLGIYILPRLDVPLFKALLGLLLVVMCPLMFFAARLPPDPARRPRRATPWPAPPAA